MTISSTNLTAANLAIAYASEMLAWRHYLACAAVAEDEGHRQIAAVFRRIAHRRSCHAGEHLHALYGQDGLQTGSTGENLREAILRELHDYTNIYPGMMRAARVDEADDVAEQFETLARTCRLHAKLLQRELDTLLPSGSVGFSG
ncbi:MAG TPA: rubrerythrin family protein [Acetobacteraceae bacterium]|jgi:rubrerythrin|nr:rubrerythrin family protein [Acetobacteraceae bacterium]